MAARKHAWVAFIDIDEDSAMVISGLLAQFSGGSRDFVSPVQDNIFAFIDPHIQTSQSPDSRTNDVQIPSSVVIRLVGEESAIDIALIVIDGSASGIPPG